MDSEKRFAPCGELSQLKSILTGSDFYHFWSVILLLMKEDESKYEIAKQYSEPILNYYTADNSQRKETYHLMEQVARHYGVYNSFSQFIETTYNQNNLGLYSNKYLKLLVKAAHLVRTDIVTTVSGKKIVYGKERTFAYELYRQWQTLIDKDGNMVINAEIPKKYQNKEDLAKLKKIFGVTDKGRPCCSFYPDLVCHHSQTDSDYQEVICEIKTKETLNSENLTTDLKKLAAYTSEKVLLYHPFKIGVFILFGGTDKAISKYKDNWGKIFNGIFNSSAMDKIYCLTYTVEEKGDKRVPNINLKPLSKIYKS